MSATATPATDWRSFHPEPEFPVAFFGRHGQPPGAQVGCDGVIGNPRDIRQALLVDVTSYRAAACASYHGVAELSLSFHDLGPRLLQAGGWLAFISSGPVAQASFAAVCRPWLPAGVGPETRTDLGANQPFPGSPRSSGATSR